MRNNINGLEQHEIQMVEDILNNANIFQWVAFKNKLNRKIESWIVHKQSTLK